MNKAHRNVGVAALAVLLAVLAPTLAGAQVKEPAPPYAQGLSHELTQATLHANYAATASSIEELHEHLHHLVNCLVGPDDPAFNADHLNPCHGLGSGAIPDSVDGMRKESLKNTLEHVQAALRTDDFILAKDAARIALWLLMTSI
jgi:hypothetical protein